MSSSGLFPLFIETHELARGLKVHFLHDEWKKSLEKRSHLFKDTPPDRNRVVNAHKDTNTEEDERYVLFYTILCSFNFRGVSLPCSNLMLIFTLSHTNI